ncbi:MAG: hypothetical protein IPM79_22155 [Polyangiaceae bacterium]|nr:hypothetical protein [Polyangiaceae bacterium]MBK8940248.1 hypothetical protein [Polyangiaceae bacterium]
MSAAAHLSPSKSALGFVVVALALAPIGGGCGKTMTKDDCDRVAKHIRGVWDSEAERAAPEKGERSARAMNVIKTEGDKMETEWRGICEREIEGRKVDPHEVDCFLAAKTIDEVQRCAGKK